MRGCGGPVHISSQYAVSAPASKPGGTPSGSPASGRCRRVPTTRLGPRPTDLHVVVVRQPEDALGDDVALHVTGTAADRERRREQVPEGPRRGGRPERADVVEHPA